MLQFVCGRAVPAPKKESDDATAPTFRIAVADASAYSLPDFAASSGARPLLASRVTRREISRFPKLLAHWRWSQSKCADNLVGMLLLANIGQDQVKSHQVAMEQCIRSCCRS